MGRTEKCRRSGKAAGILRTLYDLGLTIPAVVALLSASASAVLVAARLAEPAAMGVAVLLILTGAIQRHRARGRIIDGWYRKMHDRVKVEVGFSRLWIATGLVLLLLAIILPPLFAVVGGAGITLMLLFKGIGTAARSAQIEKDLKVAKANAAEECWRVQKIAEAAASIPLLRSPGCITRLAHYEVAPGQIGVLQFLALATVGVAFFFYMGLSLAVGLSEITLHAADPSSSNHRQQGHAPARQNSASAGTEFVESDPDPFPTYAESCRSLPNPRVIGHGLGELFERDGAAKAGCGNKAIQVPSTGAWVASGICSGEMRSVAVSAPGRTAVILYGAPARFAWSVALKDELVTAETAEPAGGDVDLVATRAGTYGFTRPFPSVRPGKEEIRLCTEVSGVANPFVRLPPPLVLLWRDLLERRAGWSWPAVDPTGREASVAFISYPAGGVTADGGCEADTSCHLDVDGARWPGEGTAFVSMDELVPYMPAP